jgi:uncharacterized protein (TIGR02001 family)
MRLILNLVILLLTISTQISWAGTLKNNSDSKSNFSENIHGFLQLGTDHVWRGISFSNHIPEIFGSMLYTFPVGFYAGVISYDTVLSKGGIGVSPIFGIKGTHHDLSYDVSARYEIYPKYVTAVTPDIFEVYGELGYALFKFLKVIGGIGYSPNYYFKSGNGIYTNAGVLVTIPENFIIDLGLGYQYTQRGGDPTNLWFKDYLNWAAGISKDFNNNIKIGFRYTQTTLNNAECRDLNICGAAYNLYARKSF